MRLVTGIGGVGKTRLALDVAAEWQAQDREWLNVAAGREAGAVAAARGVTAAAPAAPAITSLPARASVTTITLGRSRTARR